MHFAPRHTARAVNRCHWQLSKEVAAKHLAGRRIQVADPISNGIANPQ
jgi:hypothetical protein